MDSNEIGNKIAQLEKEMKQKQAEMEFLENLRKYKGEDRVISAQEMQAEIVANKKDEVLLKTNIPKLDEIIGGFKGGQVVVISGATGHGKTLFSQALLTNFVKQDASCLFFSYEVGNEDLFNQFKELPVFYLPRQTKQNSMVWLENKIMEGIAKYEAKVVFIDHLHFLLEMEKMAQAKNLSLLIGMMMRELKKIAIERNITIFLISHLKKSTMERGSMPTIDDLRDSSFVAQESDMVILIRREEESDVNNYRNKVLTNNMLCIVSKNRRTGKLGSVKLTYRDKVLMELDEIRQPDNKYERDDMDGLPEDVLTSVQSVFEN